MTHSAKHRIGRDTGRGPYVHAYDLAGNLLSKTDRKGNTIQYLYDALYRLTQKTYPDTTNVEYAYDLANKVLQVNDRAPTALPTTTWDGWWARARSMRSWRVRRSQMPTPTMRHRTTLR